MAKEIIKDTPPPSEKPLITEPVQPTKPVIIDNPPTTKPVIIDNPPPDPKPGQIPLHD